MATNGQIKPWRPPQWSANPAYSLTTATGVTYVFDAILRAEHRQEVVITKYPVQTGANIAYHAYIQPALVVLEIGMSDAMDSYLPGQWGGVSKSVSAFEVLSDLKNARQPLTLITRLFPYTNMVITSLQADENQRTVTGLRARVTLEEIFLANVIAALPSARPQDIEVTSVGITTSIPPSSTQIEQFRVQPLTSTPATGVATSGSPGSTGIASLDEPSTAIGAGRASSVNISNYPGFQGYGGGQFSGAGAGSGW
jgi:hypothetical protein